MRSVPVDLAGGGLPCRVCIVETKGALADQLHRRPFWRIQIKLGVLVSMIVEKEQFPVRQQVYDM